MTPGGGGGGGGGGLGNIGQQQQQANIQTGIANQVLNNTNQVTPYGSLKYTETGGRDVNGNWVPSFTATQTLSPEQQKIYDATTGLQTKALTDIAPGVLNNVQTAVGTPLTDNTTLRNQAYDALTARSNTDLGRLLDAQKVQLENQGIQPGSEAYNRALEPFTRAITDASNQATINAGNLAQQNLSTEQTIRNQPLQDYATLMGFGGGVTNPNYVNTPQTQVQTPDVTSPALAQYQMNQAAGAANTGGLFGLGGTILGAGIKYGLPLFMSGSDIRMKENIRHIGHTNDGQRLYFFTYKNDPATPHVGLMAQEVERIKPDAVHEIGGFKYVDYGKALVDAGSRHG